MSPRNFAWDWGWACVVSLAFGCGDASRGNYEYFPEMVESVAYDPLQANPVMRNGRTYQAAPHGVIAQGQIPFDYAPGPEEAKRAGVELTSPIPSTPETIARGEKIFLRICASCHGPKGQGDGPLVPRFPAPPPLDAVHAKSLPDGQLFHILMRGQGLMPSHAPQVAPEDRWKVVHFVRALQGGAK